MSTRSERLKRLQQGDEARQRVLSGQYNQPQAAAPISTRANALASYDTQQSERKQQEQVSTRAEAVRRLEAKESQSYTASKSDEAIQTQRAADRTALIESPAMRRLESKGAQTYEADKADEAPVRKSEVNLLRDARYNSDPVGIKQLHQGLDKMADFTKPVSDIGRELYTPGAGLSVLNAGTQAAGSLISKFAPGLGKTVMGRVGKFLGQEAIVGAPTGIGNQLAKDPQSTNRQILEAGAYGAGGGALLGGTGKLLSEGVQLGANSVKNTFAGIAGRQAEALDQVARQDLPNTVRRVANQDGVPELFPERFRRTVGEAVPSPSRAPEPVTPIVEAPVSTRKQALSNMSEAPVQQATPTKIPTPAAFKVGDDAIPTAADGTHLSEPRKVVDIQSKDGVNYYRMEGSNTYMPEGQVKSAPAARQRYKMEVTDQVAQAPKRGEKVEGERAYLRTLRNSGRLNEEVSAALEQSGKGKYTKITNVGTLGKINRRIEKDAARVEGELLNKKGKYTADDVTAGIRTIQELQKNGNVERAVTIAENLSKALTEAGQAIQAASIVKRLSADGQFLYLVRRATAAGKTVAPEDAKVFTELAVVAQKGSTSKTDTSEFMSVLNRLKAGDKVSPDELKQATLILEDAQKYLKRPREKPLTPELADTRKRDKVLSYLEKQAADARAQWNAKRNISFAAKLAEPDIVLLAKMGTYKLAKAGVKLADFTEDMVREFGEEVRPYMKDVYDRAKTLVTGTSKHISEGKLQEAQEAFERLSKSVSTPERVAEKFIKEKVIREGDINHLRDLAKQLNDLKGADAQVADMKMQEILNKYTKSNAWEKIQTVRYLAMLLNTSTQAVNAISGPMMATTGYIADVFGTIIDIAMNKTLRTPRTTTMYGSNPLRFIAGWVKNTGVGGKAGAKGVNPGGITGQHDIRGLTFKSLYNPLGLAERGLGAVSKGADYGTYRTVYDSELKKLAFLDAKNKGVKGKDAVKNHIERFLLEPPPEAVEQADKIGRATTFQRTDSLGGKLANYANSAPSVAKPFIGAVFPFIRTPINIASTAVTLTPGGIIKGLYQLSRFSQASQRDAIRSLSLGLTGSGIGAIGWYLSNLGIITGANDSGNKDVDAIREQSGEGKYRFNTSALGRYLTALLNGDGAEAAEKAAKYQEGDKQFDYNKLQPIAFPMAIGAGVRESRGKSAEQATEKVLTDSFGSLYGMSTLRGVQDVFQPSYQGTVGEKALGVPMRIAESFIKSFSPSFLAQEARRQDPILRKTSYNNGLIPDVKEYFKSRTPGLSRSLPPNLTTLGLTKQNAPGIKGQYLNPFRSEQAAYSEAAKIISELIDRTGVEKLAPTAPEKKVSGKATSDGQHVEIAIPPKRYEQMQQEQGQEIIKRILALPSLLSDAEKTEKILKIYEDVRAEQRNKVKKELGIKVSK